MKFSFFSFFWILLSVVPQCLLEPQQENGILFFHTTIDDAKEEVWKTEAMKTTVEEWKEKEEEEIKTTQPWSTLGPKEEEEVKTTQPWSTLGPKEEEEEERDEMKTTVEEKKKEEEEVKTTRDQETTLAEKETSTTRTTVVKKKKNHGNVDQIEQHTTEEVEEIVRNGGMTFRNCIHILNRYDGYITCIYYKGLYYPSASRVVRNVETRALHKMNIIFTTSVPRRFSCLLNKTFTYVSPGDLNLHNITAEKFEWWKTFNYESTHLELEYFYPLVSKHIPSLRAHVKHSEGYSREKVSIKDYCHMLPYAKQQLIFFRSQFSEYSKLISDVGMYPIYNLDLDYVYNIGVHATSFWKRIYYAKIVHVLGRHCIHKKENN